MTAETPTSRFSRPRRGSLVSLLALVIFALAASSALFVVSTRSATTQDPIGTAVATPSQADLEDVRDQAIEDEVDQLELEFEELNDSGVEGMVTLYDLDDFTLLAILVEDAGDVHPAHIHEGTCDDLEPQPFAPLRNVTNEEVSLSLVETPLPELLEDDYAVDLHLSPNELGTLIACADIDGTPAPATPVPDATPGTPDAVGGLAETPEPTEVPATDTPEPTVTPSPTQTPTPTPAPTQTPAPTRTPAPTPTPTPTEAPPTLAAVDTPEPTKEPVDTLEDGTDDISEDGTGGALNITPEAVGKGSRVTSVVDNADGTSGAGGGDDDDRTTTVLTQSAGVGSTIPWPESSTQAMSWALGVFALILGGFGLIMRRAEHNDRQPSRWNRLGL